MKGTYAKATKVPPEKTLMEIQQLIAKNGGQGFGYMSMGDSVILGFKFRNLAIKMGVKLPNPPSERATQSSLATYNQLVRQKYRQLLLCIKAKIEAVVCEIETVEQAFLPYIVLPGGATVGERTIPVLGQWDGDEPRLQLGF